MHLWEILNHKTKLMIKKIYILTSVILMLFSAEGALAAISQSPVTTDATEGALELYSFLYKNFGEKTISGVMCGDMTDGSSYKTQVDVSYLYKIDGEKYPALVGIDFLNATGAQSDESWFKSYTQAGIDLAMELWKDGGIPSFCWHWKVGNEKAFYAKGANDNYTTFDYTKGFKSGTKEWDTSSEAYKLLVADIDKVSALFLKLQEAGVAALWRPLHEASGGWFWWGTADAASYVALYRLVYDRMVNTNGVKNLIWVWNLEKDPKISYSYNADWYPGDEYVDVIGVDLYNGANKNGSNISAWNTIISKMGKNKIMALTENGPIVAPAEAEKNGDIWSWWMPWYNSWNGGFIDQTSASLWKSAMASDLIITLDEMPGWSTFTKSDPCKNLNSELKKEAECTDYKGTALNCNNQSGTSVINLTEDDDYVSFNFDMSEAGSYKVYVGYNTLYGYKQVSCSVNSISGTVNFDYDKTATEGKDEQKETLAGTFAFKKGSNEVRVTPIWTWAPIDYVRIEKDENATSYEIKVSDVEGFKVDGNALYDICGAKFAMRGVNLAYTWFKSSAYQQLKAIKNHGANAVRIVLTDGKDYGSPADDASNVKKMIETCKEYGLVCILEIHDETGSDKISDLTDAASYFAGIASTLKGTEAYVIINIANEWHNSSSAANWRDGYLKAIPIIRNAGLRHCIMIDAGGYGQNAATIHTYGKELLASDPENNIIFSIHMYGNAGNTNRIIQNIDGALNQDLALCIGEFGWYHSDGDVDEDKILSYCKEKNVGWLAWSWYGNGSPVQYLDLVKDASENPVLATQTYKDISCDWGKKITDAWKSEAVKANLEPCTNTGWEKVKQGKNSTLYFDKNTLLIETVKDGKLSITDISGKLLVNTSISKGEFEFNMEDYPQGVYIVDICGENFKFLK